eukprot:SAG11_NODE_14121_length_624_cov_1.049524_1_plen_173_part_00
MLGLTRIYRVQWRRSLIHSPWRLRIFCRNSPFVPCSTIQWCVQQWPIRLLMTENSTVLEVINANCSLEAILREYPDYDVCEVLDNSSGVSCLRRFACDSPSLIAQMQFRQQLATQMQRDRRVFTFWSCREHGTLADMLSKNRIRAFIRGLRQRGKPRLAEQQLTRRSFSTFV